MRKRKNMADELVVAMRESAEIAEGNIKPAAVHHFPLALDVDVRAGTGVSRTEFARRCSSIPSQLCSFSAWIGFRIQDSIIR